MSDGTIYNAHCKRENLTIEIPEELTNCTKDLLVRYKKNEKQIEAYLTDEGIIRASSAEIECNEFQTMMKLNDKYNIFRKYKNIHIDIIRNKTNNVKLDIFKNIVKTKTQFSTLDRIENFSANYDNMHGLLKFTRDLINIIMQFFSSFLIIKLGLSFVSYSDISFRLLRTQNIKMKRIFKNSHFY